MDKNQQEVLGKTEKQNHNSQIKVARLNGKYTIVVAIIGVIGTISAAFISNNTGKSDAIREVTSQVNTDTSNINIHIDTKDDLVNLINDLIAKNTELVTENGKLGYNNTELQNENNTLKGEKKILLEENESLKEQITQYSNLEIENKTLMDQITSLEEENVSLTNEIEELRTVTGIAPTPTPKISTGKKVSIFDLDTFQGEGQWLAATKNNMYTDTYENEYISAHYASHKSTEKDDKNRVPTYLLDYKYLVCEGKIAWPKYCKNYTGSAWIDFYSGDELIYSTEPITATDRAISFSFSVEGLETLTIVRNSTRSSNSNTGYLIYPYLNLVGEPADTN